MEKLSLKNSDPYITIYMALIKQCCWWRKITCYTEWCVYQIFVVQREIFEIYILIGNKHPGKQGCNCPFHNHKLFDPCKHRTVTTHPSVLLYVECISFHSLFVASLSTVTYLSVFIRPFPVVLICINLFLFDYLQCCFFFIYLFRSIIQCSIIQCHSLFWYWNCILGISIPHNTNHPASQ